MRVLLDTHIFIWCDQQPRAVPPVLMSELRDTQNDIFVSVANVPPESCTFPKALRRQSNEWALSFCQFRPLTPNSPAVYRATTAIRSTACSSLKPFSEI